MEDWLSADVTGSIRNLLSVYNDPILLNHCSSSSSPHLAPPDVSSKTLFVCLALAAENVYSEMGGKESWGTQNASRHWCLYKHGLNGLPNWYCNNKELNIMKFSCIFDFYYLISVTKINHMNKALLCECISLRKGEWRTEVIGTSYSPKELTCPKFHSLTPFYSFTFTKYKDW